MTIFDHVLEVLAALSVSLIPLMVLVGGWIYG